jgi:hypothetical protein
VTPTDANNPRVTNPTATVLIDRPTDLRELIELQIKQTLRGNGQRKSNWTITVDLWKFC